METQISDEVADPFDSLLSLEEEYYNEGYQLGVADGAKSGRIEGRVFGLEKGFEKFVKMGELYGRSVIWASRATKREELKDPSVSRESAAGSDAPEATKPTADHGEFNAQLPEIAFNSRLDKHIEVLFGLVEPASLNTQNTDNAVEEFDDRLRRAEGKAKIIEKTVKELPPDGPSADIDEPVDFTTSRQSRTPGRTTRSDNMEDFIGHRGLRT